MYISQFKIENYKSYHDTSDIELHDGINIITGQNNSGKTALLQILSLNFSYHPHRSTKTIPSVQTVIAQQSSVYIEITLTKEEIINSFLNYPQTLNFYMDPLVQRINENEQLKNEVFFDRYFNNNNKIVSHFQNGQILTSAFKLPSCAEDNNSNLFSYNCVNKEIMFTGKAGKQPDFSNQLLSQVRSRIYCFKAERLNIGHSTFGLNNSLLPDASNLPEVLNILQGDKIRFERFNSYVRKIFPQIFQISIRPYLNQVSCVEIVVWNEDPILERSDLVVPLSECGTGLGQVLAILYVILTSDFSKVIIIDEPNSFLHPGATRKLIEILKEHPQHQFIISTHSPSTIAASNPKTIHIVKTKDAQSSIESINVTETNNQQLYLAEIGAKLSDVFGADNILWVEGKTEEICFPKIIEKINGISLMGTVVLSVINTGDFQRKNSELIFKMYEKLSVGKGLLPPAIGFFFDSEKLSKTEKEDLARRSNNKVVFTKRKMFENYLLNTNAIFNVLNGIEEIGGLGITIEVVKNWIEENRWDKKFINQIYAKDKKEADWFINVDGANFLESLFSSISKTTLVFDKIKHSVSLCEWIIENSFEDLKDIENTVSSFLKPMQPTP